MPMEEISPHVESLPVPLKWFPQPYPPNVYLVHDGRDGALVDSGFSDDESYSTRMAFLRERPEIALRYIILTHHHYDHSSGAHRLREATGARVVVHRAEERLLLSPEIETGDFEIPEDQKEAREQAKKWREEAAKAVPDVRVEDGDALQVGGLTLRCVHAPGHTAGHLCVLLEEERLLFAGDNVLGVGTAAIAPPPHGDMAEYVRSLRKMQALESELLAPGHGPMVKDPHRKLQELIDHRAQREEQILSLLAKGKGDVKSLVRAIYPELDKRLLQMATGQVLSHLHKLAAEGRVRLEGKGPETRVEPL
jgi:glyoxylase-like metal-dependent hydrolase (beta-lactamase superfamily II)